MIIIYSFFQDRKELPDNQEKIPPPYFTQKVDKLSFYFFTLHIFITFAMKLLEFTDAYLNVLISNSA